MSRSTPGGLGDDHHRMSALGQHLEHGTGDAEVAFDRLVGVGVRPQRDGSAGVAGPGKLGTQQRRRVRLEHESSLEIEAGRESEVRVARPRVAVDAPVLAAAVRIDGAVERDVRGVVVADDSAARIRREGGAKLRRREVPDIRARISVDILALRPVVLPAVSPAVVEVLARDLLESPRRVADRAASLEDGSPATRAHRPRPPGGWCDTRRPGPRVQRPVIRCSIVAGGVVHASAHPVVDGTNPRCRSPTAPRSNASVHPCARYRHRNADMSTPPVRMEATPRTISSGARNMQGAVSSPGTTSSHATIWALSPGDARCRVESEDIPPHRTATVDGCDTSFARRPRRTTGTRTASPAPIGTTGPAHLVVPGTDGICWRHPSRLR